MTVLGKVLAIVNLLLSVGVAALIVGNYVARTNWHNAYVEAEKQIKAAQDNARVYDVKRKESEEQLKTETGKLNDQIGELNKKLASTVADLDAEKKKLASEATKSTQLQADNGGMSAELDRRQKEIDLHKELLARRDSQIKDMEKKVEDQRAAMVEAQIAARSEQDRNNNLIVENERLNKEIQRQAAGGGGALASRDQAGQQDKQVIANPDIEGLIEKIDGPSGLVTLSIGSDAGLNKGNVLEVFRLKPEPKYVGSLQVVAVRPDHAVGKPLGRTLGQVRIGDHVASNVLTKR
jgi:hypothetical protein